MTYHYAPGELNVPEGTPSEDLDWMVLWWELNDELLGTSKPIQYILGPGVLIIRRIALSGKREIEVCTNDYGHGTMSALAAADTQDYLDAGITWTTKPSLVDFTHSAARTVLEYYPSSFYDGHDITTLGDALAHGNEEVLTTVVNHINFVNLLIGTRKD